MQAYDHNDRPMGDAEPFEKQRMAELLARRDVKEVRVFKLRKGMRLSVEGEIFKITAVRPNGKVTMRKV